MSESDGILNVLFPVVTNLYVFFVSLQSISSITEGVSTAASTTEEPMQTDETASAEAAPAEEGAAAMETQAEVNAVRRIKATVCMIFLAQTNMHSLCVYDLQFCFYREKPPQQQP